MDPNETLIKLRNLSRYAMLGNPVDYMDLVEAFHDLDEWLSRGGFLPEAWENRR